MINWEHIRDAVEAVLDGPARRIEGTGFKVYSVPGGIVRIDLKDQMKGADNASQVTHSNHDEGQGHKRRSEVRGA
jgi:hypothetical protein